MCFLKCIEMATIDETHHGTESALFFTNLTECLFMHSADLKKMDKKSKAMIDRDNWIQFLDKKELQNTPVYCKQKEAELLHFTEQRIPFTVLNECIENN